MIRLTDANASGTPDCELGGAGGNVDISADINGEKSDSVIRFNVDGSEKVRIDSSGFVGIENTSPNLSLAGARNLVIGSGSGDRGLTIMSGTSGVGHIEFSDGTGSSAEKTAGGIRYYHNSNYMRFNTNGGTERLRIDANGKVIIGTEFVNAGNAPAQISFYLSGVRGSYGGLGTNAVIFDNQTAAVDAGGTLQLAGYSGTAAVVKAAIRGGNEGSASTQAGYFSVFTRPASGGLSEKFRIDSSGNVTKPNNFYILVDRDGNQTGYNASNISDVIIWNRVRTSESSTGASSNFNTSTGLFTAPVTGMYLFHASVNCNYNNEGAWLVINGSRPNFANFYPNGTTSADGMITYHLTSGDTVGIKWYDNGNTNATINNNALHTWWRIILLG